MATVVVRRLMSTPRRSAADTWELMTKLIARPGSPACDELHAVAGLVTSQIAAEAPRDAPIVVAGAGPRLRIYCLYDENAVVGDDANEDSLAWDPTQGDWAMLIPCAPEDLAWLTSALGEKGTRVTAYSDSADKSPEDAKADREATVNVGAFKRR